MTLTCSSYPGVNTESNFGPTPIIKKKKKRKENQSLLWFIKGCTSDIKNLNLSFTREWFHNIKVQCYKYEKKNIKKKKN